MRYNNYLQLKIVHFKKDESRVSDGQDDALTHVGQLLQISTWKHKHLSLNILRYISVLERTTFFY